MSFGGINVRKSGSAILFDVLLLDGSGLQVTTGTTSLYIYECQSDGSFKSYDFADNTLKTTALTTETLSMTHRTGNNGTTNTGIWTATLSTLTALTVGNVYECVVKNTNAYPNFQRIKFQYGGADGDLTVSSGGVSLSSAGLDSVITEGTVNARQALALVFDAVCGVLSGAAGTSVTIKDPTGTTTRIVATVDTNGDRSAMTLTPPV